MEGERTCNIMREREREREQTYLSFIQHENLTSYRFVADSSRTTLRTLIWNLWNQFQYQSNLKKSNLQDTYYFNMFYVGWLRDTLVCDNSPSLLTPWPWHPIIPREKKKKEKENACLLIMQHSATPSRWPLCIGVPAYGWAPFWRYRGWGESGHDAN